MNDLLKRSKEFATQAHAGQTRKTSGRPYITHPFRVAKILSDAGMPPAVICAGDNHDTVEDTTVTIEDIRREFGDEVASLVAFNTEDKSKTWEERKTHTIDHLKNGTLAEKALVVADKYANLLEMMEDFKGEYGEKVWDSFKRGKAEQYWYFSNVAKSAMENLKEEDIPAFFLDYQRDVEAFFGENK